ncbi:helix-turn-helix transcriptional regulator [Actibacterium lipolyticum]|uniref:Regulatory protein SdiA n=1 Tax=Actibacterium lipolyticum TaxID=1524263 RepID=A0A238JYD6_9RHOB|nr:autoinducer binding domain-containing protein [Actibacterium lipolyticum]SMX34716.1 Regulatory protein SdiA [Actibacterium lipolyticum]
MSLLSDYTEQLLSLAPSGCYIGLRVGFSFPAEELNKLPDDWVEFYTANGLVVHDPVMKWVYANHGFVRWSEIGLDDPRGVLESAARFGLRYGVVASITAPGEQGKRSYGNFMRSDREFQVEEIEALHDILQRLHDAGAQQLALTNAEIEALTLQSQGLRLKQIAGELDISISAVKARLANAKRKLGAQTPSHAASIARTRGLL